MKDSGLPIPKGKTEGVKESLKPSKPVIQPTTLKQRLEEEHLSVSSKKQRLAKHSPKRTKSQTARGKRGTKPGKATKSVIKQGKSKAHPAMESVKWQQFALQQKKRKLEKIDWKNKKLVFTE